MKTLKIKTANFIEWMFNSGADQDQEHEKLLLAERIIADLMKGKATVTAQEVLEQCEQSIIPLDIVEGHENDGDEIGDVYGNDFRIILI